MTMKCNEFLKQFKCIGPVILPVIHVWDNTQTMRNVRLAVREGAQGIFLINHDFGVESFLPIIKQVRKSFPSLWLGVNFLSVTGKNAFPILGSLAKEGVQIDAYWADDARIDETADKDKQTEAVQIANARKSANWQGLYFGGTAFKKQRPVDPMHFKKAAAVASAFMDVVTTSGVATGKAADIDKITSFRSGADKNTLAIASGITPENIKDYCPYIEAVLVSTGINHEGDFYNINPTRLRRLMTTARNYGSGQTLDDPGRINRSYLKHMAPNVKGKHFAWLDPSTMYINAHSFHTLVEDLSQPFVADTVDVVAGIDAAGFVLGSAIAIRLGVGFLTIRKAGKLPVETDSVAFVNYSRRSQYLEMRKPAFAPGTRVLLVDQWIETGGTITGGIDLIERQNGNVVGLACICLEENKNTESLRKQYKCSSAIMTDTDWQTQCNSQHMEYFDHFDPMSYFPTRLCEK